MANKKRIELSKAFDDITGGGEKQKKKEGEGKAKPVIGVALLSAELERLAAIAEELGQSRHAVLQYAVRDFMRRYDAGEKPTVETRTVKVLKVE